MNASDQYYVLRAIVSPGDEVTDVVNRVIDEWFAWKKEQQMYGQTDCKDARIANQTLPSTQPPPRATVADEGRALDAELDALEAFVERLELRLEPILTPPLSRGPDASQGIKPAECSSIVLSVRAARLRVYHAGERLAQLEHRLEL